MLKERTDELTARIIHQIARRGVRILGYSTPNKLEEIEREYIVAALKLNNGNQTHTAAQLQIGSATLHRKLKSYGLIGNSRTVKRRRQRHSPHLQPR